MVHLRKTAINNSTSEKNKQLCIDLQLGWTSKNSDLGAVNKKKKKTVTSIKTKRAAKKSSVAHSTRCRMISKSCMSARTRSQRAPRMAIQPEDRGEEREEKKNILEITERSSA